MEYNHILVAEDDIALNKLITTVLQKNGHHVFSTFNGSHALNELEKVHIDIIVDDARIGGLHHQLE